MAPRSVPALSPGASGGLVTGLGRARWRNALRHPAARPSVRGGGPGRVPSGRKVSWVVEHRSRSRVPVRSSLGRGTSVRRATCGGRGPRRRDTRGRVEPYGPVEIPAGHGSAHPRRAGRREPTGSRESRRKAESSRKDRGAGRRGSCLVGRGRSNATVGRKLLIRRALPTPLTRGGDRTVGDAGARVWRRSSRGNGGARGLRMSIRSKVSWVDGPFSLTGGGYRRPWCCGSRSRIARCRSSSSPGGTGEGCLQRDRGHPSQGVRASATPSGSGWR